jgi:hypothetical protein
MAEEGTMSHHVRIALVLALLGGLALAGAVLAAPAATSIERWVLSGGGGHTEADPYALDGTIGQPLVGTELAGGYTLCAGFWCGAEAGHRIYLPLVVREH